jgi:hypothetical protein
VKIACICCTYKRPLLLSEAIECFVRQDYQPELCELVILDDCGQYPSQPRGDRWRVVSIDRRFRTLGEKRNASAGLASSDVDAYCVWDDDDLYLPWHLSCAAVALEKSDWCIPSQIWMHKPGRFEPKATGGLFHGAWSFRASAFERAGGYPFMQSGQDQGLFRRFKMCGDLRRGDPFEVTPRRSYVYRWFTASGDGGRPWHLSCAGGNGYESLANRPFELITDLQPRWQRDWLAWNERAEAALTS